MANSRCGNGCDVRILEREVELMRVEIADLRTRVASLPPNRYVAMEVPNPTGILRNFTVMDVSDNKEIGKYANRGDAFLVCSALNAEYGQRESTLANKRIWCFTGTNHGHIGKMVYTVGEKNSGKVWHMGHDKSVAWEIYQALNKIGDQIG